MALHESVVDCPTVILLGLAEALIDGLAGGIGTGEGDGFGEGTGVTVLAPTPPHPVIVTSSSTDKPRTAAILNILEIALENKNTRALTHAA